MGQCPRGPGSNLVAAKEGWAVSITQIGGAACRPVGSPNGASGSGCSPRCPATLRVEVGSRAAVRSEGGALGGQRGRPGSRPSGTNRCSRFPWGVEGGPGHPPRGPALGPLADHVPVVGDDRVLQLHHRGEDPLHLKEGHSGAVAHAEQEEGDEDGDGGPQPVQLPILVLGTAVVQEQLWTGRGWSVSCLPQG